MAPMLAVAFRLGAEDLPFGVALLLLYGLGHCGVIVLAGTFTEMVQRYMNWNQRSRGALILKRVCGVLVILGGLYLAWKP
jgi:cytochrome c-type biogenesis protein